MNYLFLPLSCANNKTKFNENNPKAIREYCMMTDQALAVDCELQDNIGSNISEDGALLRNPSALMRC